MQFFAISLFGFLVSRWLLRKEVVLLEKLWAGMFPVDSRTTSAT
jgi:hypothetical protein